MTCNKNIVSTGDEITIRGMVDQSQSKLDITSYFFVIKEMTIRIADDGRTQEKPMETKMVHSV